MEKRTCEVCKRVLPIDDGVQRGYYCCGEYYCDDLCRDIDMEILNMSWDKHYTEDGECCFTEWEE